MRKRFIFVFVLIMSLFLVSCEDPKNDLGVPDVTLAGDVVSWNSVKDAKHYLLYIDEKIVRVNTTSYSLVDENLEAGTYTIYVVAVKDDKVSAPSKQVKYTVTVTERRLDPPVVKLTNSVISWNAVTNAVSYIVKVNGREIAVTGTSFDLSSESLEPGTYDIKVVAVKGSNISLDSIIVKYVIQSEEDVNLMTKTLLKKFDPTYDLDLTEEDFLDEFDYEDYLDALNTVNIYVSAFAEANLSKEDAISLFNDLYDFFNEDSEVVDLNKVLELVDIFVANNVTAEVATTFLLKVFSSPDLELPAEVQLILNDYGLLINDSLEIIFNYVFELRANLPADFIGLLNMLINEEEIDLPLATIIRIKNETVVALENTLLTAEEFETLYQLVWILGTVLNDNEIVNIDDELEYLSLLTHQTLKVGLLFIKDFTAEDFETVSTLITNLMAEIDVEGQQETSVPPIETIIELLAFMNGYVEAFTLNNQVEVLALEALLDKELLQPLYELFVNQIIDMAYPPDEYQGEVNINTYLKSSLTNEYYSIVGIMELFMTLEKDFVEAIIESNGSIIDVILNLDVSEENPIESINQILGILGELEVYNDLLLNALTKDALEDILSVLIIPIMIESEFYLAENALEIETGLREIIPSISQLMINFLALENDIFKALKTFDVYAYINDTYGYEEPETLGLSIGIIHLLDEILTIDNKLLIDDSIDLIFDNILVNDTLQQLLEIVGEDLAQFKLEITDLKDQLYSEISTLASYDYTALNFEEEKAIMTFLNNLGISFNIETQLETDLEAIARAIPLLLGIPEQTMYRTSYLIFSFAPDENGYYELLIPYEGSEFQVIVRDSSYEYIHDYWVYDYDLNDFNVLFLEAGQTYYIALDYDFNISYEYVEIEILKQTYDNLALDTPIVLQYTEELAIYEFHSVEANLYTLNLTSDDLYQGFIVIKDQNNNSIYDQYHAVTSIPDGRYNFYLEAGELAYIYFIRFENNYADLNVTLVVADSLKVVSDEAVTLNSSFEKKMYHFVAPEAGFYDLKFTSVTFSTFTLDLLKQYNNDDFSAMYALEGGDVQSVNVYLEASTALIFTIESNIGSYIVDMTISKVNLSSLNVLELNQTVNKIVTLSDGIDFKINVVQPGLYKLHFKASNVYNFGFVLYDNEGNVMENIYSHSPEEGVLYSFDLVLSPGEYYLDLTIYPEGYDETHDILIGVELMPPKYMFLDMPQEIALIVEEYEKTEMYIFMPLEDGDYVINVDPENEDFWTIRVIEIEYVNSMDGFTDGYGYGTAEYFLEGNTIYCIFVTVNDDNVLNLTIELEQ